MFGMMFGDAGHHPDDAERLVDQEPDHGIKAANRSQGIALWSLPPIRDCVLTPTSRCCCLSRERRRRPDFSRSPHADQVRGPDASIAAGWWNDHHDHS